MKMTCVPVVSFAGIPSVLHSSQKRGLRSFGILQDCLTCSFRRPNTSAHTSASPMCSSFTGIQEYRNSACHRGVFGLFDRYVGPSTPCITASLNESFPQRDTIVSVENAIVWYRIGDLRVRDHPGLQAAGESTRASIVPLFVVTPETPVEVFPILHHLKRDLQSRRGDLVVRYAASECIGLVDFIADEYECNAVHLMCDTQSRLRDDARWIASELARRGGALAACKLVCWFEELRDFRLDPGWLATIPVLYPDFLRWGVRARAAVTSSTVDFEPEVLVPGLPSCKLDVGDLAAVEAKRRDANDGGALSDVSARYAEDTARLGVRDPVALLENVVDAEGDPWEAVVLDMLARLEAYSELDIARTLEPLFWFGLVSLRRVYEMVYEFERLNGRLFRPIFRLGAKSVLSWLDAREFASALAERELGVAEVTVDGVHRPKFWRWRGNLIRYVSASTPMDGVEQAGMQERPALLLLHGFGASTQHWGRNIAELSKNFDVFALCLIGFGRSEKPPYVYTQHLWEAQVAEFVRDVIGRRVYIAGNSVGGYIACATGVDLHPELCDGIVLINPAGSVIPVADYSEQQKLTSAQTKFSLSGTILRKYRPARAAFSQFLLYNLRRNINSILSKVYPVSDPADTKQLAAEIYRNSLDAGAIHVLMSGFVLPEQRPYNELFASYTGPVLVFQGTLDPLNNAARRAELLKDVYPAATVTCVDAGHCPHDEAPEQFHKAVLEWLQQVNTIQAGKSPVSEEAKLVSS